MLSFFVSAGASFLVFGEGFKHIRPFARSHLHRLPPPSCGFDGDKMQSHRQETPFSSGHHRHRRCGFSSSITARKERGVREGGRRWQSLFVMAINHHFPPDRAPSPSHPIHHKKTTALSHPPPVLFTRNQTNPKGYCPWPSSFVGRSIACAAGGTQMVLAVFWRPKKKKGKVKEICICFLSVLLLRCSQASLRPGRPGPQLVGSYAHLVWRSSSSSWSSSFSKRERRGAREGKRKKQKGVFFLLFSLAKGPKGKRR